MTRFSNSNPTAGNDNANAAAIADEKMAWSFSWEFDWSPAAAANAEALRQPRRDAHPDALTHLLDKALAFAG
jgi:hypothetical protein